MHEPEDTPLEPVAHRQPVLLRRRSPLAWVVGLSCASVSLLAFAAAIAFFTEFAATDQGRWQLLQAAGLAFGVPALMVVPYGLMAWWALRRGRASLLGTTLLMLPWAIIGGLWVVIGRFDPLIGAVPAVTALLAMLWVLKEGPDFTAPLDPLS